VTLAEIIAVRHGESEANRAAEAAEAEQADWVPVPQRDPDVPLTARGRMQAQAVGRWLAQHCDRTPTTVCSSPFVRARQTAELALTRAQLHLPVRVDERLRDREVGLLDRLTARGVAARFPDEAARRRWLGEFYYRPPAGEAWTDVALRLRSFLGDIAAVDGPAVIFAHDAVIVLLRYVLEGLDEQQVLELARARPVGTGSITHLVRTPATEWQLAGVSQPEPEPSGFQARADG
jgi:broad specificity phosphatase PhoE